MWFNEWKIWSYYNKNNTPEDYKEESLKKIKNNLSFIDRWKLIVLNVKNDETWKTFNQLLDTTDKNLIKNPINIIHLIDDFCWYIKNDKSELWQQISKNKLAEFISLTISQKWYILYNDFEEYNDFDTNSLDTNTDNKDTLKNKIFNEYNIFSKFFKKWDNILYFSRSYYIFNIANKDENYINSFIKSIDKILWKNNNSKLNLDERLILAWQIYSFIENTPLKDKNSDFITQLDDNQIKFLLNKFSYDSLFYISYKDIDLKNIKLDEFIAILQIAYWENPPKSVQEKLYKKINISNKILKDKIIEQSIKYNFNNDKKLVLNFFEQTKKENINIKLTDIKKLSEFIRIKSEKNVEKNKTYLLNFLSKFPKDKFEKIVQNLIDNNLIEWKDLWIDNSLFWIWVYHKKLTVNEVISVFNTSIQQSLKLFANISSKWITKEQIENFLDNEKNIIKQWKKEIIEYKLLSFFKNDTNIKIIKEKFIRSNREDYTKILIDQLIKEWFWDLLKNDKFIEKFILDFNTFLLGQNIKNNQFDKLVKVSNDIREEVEKAVIKANKNMPYTKILWISTVLSNSIAKLAIEKYKIKKIDNLKKFVQKHSYELEKSWFMFLFKNNLNKNNKQYITQNLELWWKWNSKKENPSVMIYNLAKYLPESSVWVNYQQETTNPTPAKIPKKFLHMSYEWYLRYKEWLENDKKILQTTKTLTQEISANKSMLFKNSQINKLEIKSTEIDWIYILEIALPATNKIVQIKSLFMKDANYEAIRFVLKEKIWIWISFEKWSWDDINKLISEETDFTREPLSNRDFNNIQSFFQVYLYKLYTNWNFPKEFFRKNNLKIQDLVRKPNNFLMLFWEWMKTRLVFSDFKLEWNDIYVEESNLTKSLLQNKYNWGYIKEKIIEDWNKRNIFKWLWWFFKV